MDGGGATMKAEGRGRMLWEQSRGEMRCLGQES